jgi:hypothetical protein
MPLGSKPIWQPASVRRQATNVPLEIIHWNNRPKAALDAAESRASNQTTSPAVILVLAFVQ